MIDGEQIAGQSDQITKCNVCNLFANDECSPRGVQPPGLKFRKLQGTPVPTVSEWGMIVMALLMGAGGIWMLRRRQAAEAL